MALKESKVIINKKEKMIYYINFTEKEAIPPKLKRRENINKRTYY